MKLLFENVIHKRKIIRSSACILLGWYLRTLKDNELVLGENYVKTILSTTVKQILQSNKAKPHDFTNIMYDLSQYAPFILEYNELCNIFVGQI